MAATSTSASETITRQGPDQETLLKITKEITVKFIEVGRITPATFAKEFAAIYQAIEKTLNKEER